MTSRVVLAVALLGAAATVVAAVANRPTRPQWNQDGCFRRFAR